MATTRRIATASWQGTMARGSGRLNLAGGAGRPALDLAWASPLGAPDATTNPGELLAGAHASCFAMALSHGLTVSGAPPRRIQVTATCEVEEGESGFRIARMRLEVEGDVPGAEERAFRLAVSGAEAMCPITRVVQDTMEVDIEARLTGDGDRQQDVAGERAA